MAEVRCVHAKFFGGEPGRCELPWGHINGGTQHQATIDGVVRYWNDDDEWEEQWL